MSRLWHLMTRKPNNAAGPEQLSCISICICQTRFVTSSGNSGQPWRCTVPTLAATPLTLCCAVVCCAVQVYDRDFLKPDDLLGQLELPVKTILTWTQVGPPVTVHDAQARGSAGC